MALKYKFHFIFQSGHCIWNFKFKSDAQSHSSQNLPFNLYTMFDIHVILSSLLGSEKSAGINAECPWATAKFAFKMVWVEFNEPLPGTALFLFASLQYQSKFTHLDTSPSSQKQELELSMQISF